MPLINKKITKRACQNPLCDFAFAFRHTICRLSVYLQRLDTASSGYLHNIHAF